MAAGTIKAYKDGVVVTTPFYDVIPLTIQFGVTITSGVPTAVHWDFGDGGTSDILDPLHTFSSYGNHRVVMTLTDSGGDTVAPFFQIVLGKLDFTADRVSGQKPLLVEFTDTSIAPEGCSFTNAIWSYGDGATGMAWDTTHLYVDDAQYNVTLSATITT